MRTTDQLNQYTLSGTCYSLFGQSITPLLFIHGVGMNQHVWEPQIEYFKQHYQVIVYDMLGHGDSPMPPPQAQLHHYVAQLEELIDHLELSEVSLIGHSTGALISVGYALENRGKVQSMIPLNIVYDRTQAQSLQVNSRADQVLEQRKISGIKMALDRWFLNKQDQNNLDKIKVIEDFLLNVDPIGYGRTYKMFAQSDKLFVGKLDQLSMPILYLTGTNDPNSTTWMSQQMAEQTPNGKLIAINAEAHMMAYISPQIVNPVLEQFIQTHS